MKEVKTRDTMTMADCGTITTTNEQGKVLQTEYVYQYNLDRDNRQIASKVFVPVVEVRAEKTVDLIAPVSTLEHSNDVVAQALNFAMQSAETMLTLELMAMKNSKVIDTVKSANRLTNRQLADYLRDNWNKVLDNDLFSVAVLYALSARMVMAKLKGKYKQHADNLFIRNRRFNFIKAYKVFVDNGLLLTRPYNLDSIGKARDNAFEMVRDYMSEVVATKKDLETMLTTFKVKARLNALTEDMRRACEKEEQEKKEMLYSDIELLNVYVLALIEYVYITKETDLFINSPIVSTYFDTFVDRMTERESFKIDSVSAHTYAMRELDKAIGVYRRIAIGNIKDVDRTDTGSEVKGIKKYLGSDDFRMYQRISRAIVKSEKIKGTDKADLIAILYMRMQGYGYKAIASYLCITERSVQNGLRNIGLVVSTIKQFSERINIERDKSRHLVPVPVKVEKVEQEEITTEQAMQTDKVYHKPQGAFNHNRDTLIVYDSKVIKTGRK